VVTHDDMMASTTPQAPVGGPAGAQVVVPRRLGLSLRSQAADLEQPRSHAAEAPRFGRLRLPRSERGRDTVSCPLTEGWGTQPPPAEATYPGPPSYLRHPKPRRRLSAAPAAVMQTVIA
jgi:hypothetical protein